LVKGESNSVRKIIYPCSCSEIRCRSGLSYLARRTIYNFVPTKRTKRGSFCIQFVSKTLILSLYSSIAPKTKPFVLCDGRGHLLASDFEIEILDEMAKKIFLKYLTRESLIKK
jgi:hypothetical protein